MEVKGKLVREDDSLGLGETDALCRVGIYTGSLLL